MKKFRNLLIGFTLLAIGGYFLFVTFNLLGFSLDRQLLMEDVYTMGCSNSLKNLANEIQFAEQNFANQYYLARHLVDISIVGSNFIIALLSLIVMRFGYRVCYCNLFPKK